MMNHGSSKKYALISTTQRCGSSWIASVCSKITGGPYAQYISGLEQQLMDLNRMDEDCAERIAQFSVAIRNVIEKTSARVFKTHDMPSRFFQEFLRTNKDFYIINIIRDFRDVLISRLMYNRYYLPGKNRACESAFVASHAGLTDQQLAQEFYGTQEMLDWLASWKLFSEPVCHERYICLNYEELLESENLKSAISQLANNLTGGLPEHTINAITSATRFEKIELNGSQARNAREVKHDFCRKGEAGDYKRFLTPRQSQTLKFLML